MAESRLDEMKRERRVKQEQLDEFWEEFTASNGPPDDSHQKLIEAGWRVGYDYGYAIGWDNGFGDASPDD